MSQLTAMREWRSALERSGATDHAADEVVTHAHVRDVQLPRGAGTAALITLDNGHDHTKPNTFGVAGLLELGDVLERLAERDDLAAVAVTGKPFIFAVGADLTGVPSIDDRETALTIGRLGHDVFRRLGELRVPSFALINGAALGGGVELALHCTYRTISSGVPMLGLPECFLGMVPGWGGTYLLPRLIGARNALKIIIENALNQNTTIKGPEAYRLGMADAMFEPADFLEESLRWVGGVVNGQTSPQRPATDDADAWQQAVDEAAFLVDGKLHGAAPAPLRALDLVAAARTATRDEAFEAESQALAELIMSDELRAGLYAFDLTQKRAKRPAGAPDASLARQVNKVGVVGAGLMAAQLALLFVRRLRVPVVLTDLDRERVDTGVAYVRGEIDKLESKGRLSADTANRCRSLVSGALTSETASVFADADFVIEAVFEDLDVKKQVFADVEAAVPAETVLATNTSSLPVGEMAAGLAHPQRLVGFHFFNPVAVLPLVEIATTRHTDDATLATAFATAKALRKSAVRVADAPAFVVNRVLTRFLGEIIAAVDEGTPLEVAEASVEPLGLPMSPFMLLQLVGPPIALHVSQTLHAAFPDRFGVSGNLRALVDAGVSNLYGHDLAIDPQVIKLLTQGETPSSAEQVCERALEAVAQEIRIMLDEGVVADAADIDLCMLTGAGWPFHLGGITPYLDRTGVAERVTGGRFQPVGVATLPG